MSERVLLYSAELDQAGFIASRLQYDATLRNLELVGEAATHVLDEVRRVYGQVPWRLLIATRNRLIHGYLGIDDDIVWNIVQVEVPRLLLQLRGDSETGARRGRRQRLRQETNTMGTTVHRLLLQELTREAARAIAPTALLVFPVGAPGQHGPHLPVGTDHFAVE